MKIIKEGQLPGKTIHRSTCHQCKTEVEYLQEEGRITYDQRDGNFISVTCPVCGSCINSNFNRSEYNGSGRF